MICPLTLLHEDLEKRRRAEYLMVFGDDSEEGWDLYKEVLTVITYQKLEQLCKGDASDQRILQELLDRHRIIIADECHYWSEFSAFNINTHYSLDALLQAEKDHTVVYMSATGRDTWKLLEEKGGPTQSERIYRLPQYYEYVKAAYFYARHNLVTILKRLPAGEKQSCSWSLAMIWPKWKNIWRHSRILLLTFQRKISEKVQRFVGLREGWPAAKGYSVHDKGYGCGNRIERSGCEAYFYRPMESSGNSSVTRTQALLGCR